MKRMDVNEVNRGRNLPGNKRRSTNYNDNVFRASTKLSRPLIVDPPKKSSKFSPKSSSVLTLNPRENTICKYWMSGHCNRGDNCWYLHSWSRGDGFAMLAKLEGHKKTVRGIVLPSGHDKLYSGSSDGTVRIWDCNTGQCVDFINLGDEAGSLITEGPWVFIGMKNVVKALNINTAVEFNLKGPVGQVFAMIVARDMLFAGAQNGGIVAWRTSCETSSFQPVVSLEGHTGAVSCFAFGEKMLFSGSIDETIRVWDTDTFQCIKTLNGHAAAVTSLIHCNGYLFSCSLDCTIKAWFATNEQDWEVIYTHNVENGALALCGMNDAETKPVILCSLNDDTVRLYEVPSFNERGRIFSNREVRVIERGPSNLFFTGDASGSLTVWNWLQKPQEATSGS